MKTIPTQLPDVVIIEPDYFSDSRGNFFESYNKLKYKNIGITDEFVQDNISSSIMGTLRGLHFQTPPYSQGKLVSVLSGEVFDVVADIRLGSPTFGKWISVTLNNNNKRQLYIPPGFAHGFMATSDNTIFHYKCTKFYVTTAEVSIAWDDPILDIHWPDISPLLSNKDKLAQKLSECSHQLLPKF